LKKQNDILHQAILESNIIRKEQSTQIVNLKQQRDNLQELNDKQFQIATNQQEIIKNLNTMYKAKKKQQFSVFLKGAGVGVTATVITGIFLLK
jgi:hypothetical protein